MEQTHEGHRSRLRDRYMGAGADSLADHELLELLLTYAIPRRDTNALAHTLLNRFGSLEGVFTADIAALAAIDGVGERTAVFLHLQHDVQRRLALRRFASRDGRVRLSTPAASAAYAHALLASEPLETVLLLCLNAQRMLIGARPIASGTVAEAAVYPRIAAEQALLQRAHSAILVHNHPSGNPAPSGPDEETTAAVRAALESIGVALSDHLIVGCGCVYSFSARIVMSLSGDTVETMTLEDYLAHETARTPALSLVMEPYA